MAARRRTRASWAKAICAKWQQSVKCIIEVGRLLEKAKGALPHGQFEKMVESDLPFGPRAARMLMAIARNAVLTKRKFASDLPASWYTLYELTRLPEPDLCRALASGTVGPETKRRDVVQLREEIRQRDLAKGNRRIAKCTVHDLDELVDAGKRFGTFYADPPWPYDRNFANKMGSAHKFYPAMELDEIMALPVSRLAARNSHLHLWTTGSFLFHARDVLDSWGFEYRSRRVAGWTARDARCGSRLRHPGLRQKLPFARAGCSRFMGIRIQKQLHLGQAGGPRGWILLAWFS